MEPDANVKCSFCGAYAPITSAEVVSLLVSLPAGATQELWVHYQCLLRTIHPSVPMLPPEEDEPA